MIDRGDIRWQSTVAAISGLTAGRWLYRLRYGRQPDCKIQRSKWNGQRD